MGQSRTMACYLAAYALLQLPLGIRAQPASPHLGKAVAWEVFLEGPHNLIAGLVLDERGNPLGSALVSLAGTQVRAISDDQGRFELFAPAAGDWVFQVSAAQATQVEQTLTLPTDSHIRLVVLLNTRIPLCGLRVCGGTSCEDLSLDVLDAETGAPPSVPITIQLEHESGTKQATWHFDAQGLQPTFIVGLGEAVRTVGFHNIQVTAPGYLPWRIEHVWLEVTEECHPILIGRSHVVPLQPSRN